MIVQNTLILDSFITFLGCNNDPKVINIIPINHNIFHAIRILKGFFLSQFSIVFPNVWKKLSENWVKKIKLAALIRDLRKIYFFNLVINPLLNNNY